MNLTYLRSLLLPAFAMVFFVSTSLEAHATSQPKAFSTIEKQFAALEASSGGRIGVSAIDTANHQRIQYRADERFPMGCTSKVMGVAAILKKSMKDKSLLQQRIQYKKEDLVTWSPVTEKHVAEGMTVSELCAAALTQSDNTAMNLLLKPLKGLQGMNNFARSLQDKTFRADHDWPAEALSGGPGNVYDSSTPQAMASSLQKLTQGSVLAMPQREQLLAWMKANSTGDARIRAGVPKGWIVADKTGTGSNYGSTNDIAVIWPPHCSPIIVAIYFTMDHNKAANKRDDMVEYATRIVLNSLAEHNACIRLRSIH